VKEKKNLSGRSGREIYLSIGICLEKGACLEEISSQRAWGRKREGGLFLLGRGSRISESEKSSEEGKSD